MKNKYKFIAFYGDHDAVRAEIVEGLARTLWVLQWADHEEGAGRSYPGYDLEDVAPDTPEEAFAAASRLVRAIERKAIAQRMFLGDPTTIAGIYRKAIESSTDSPYRFGVMLAHHHQGTGLRWEDDHQRSWAFELPDLLVALEEIAAETDPPSLSSLGRASRGREVSRSACAFRLGPAPAFRTQEVAARRRRRRGVPSKGAREKRYVLRRRRLFGAGRTSSLGRCPPQPHSPRR